MLGVIGGSGLCRQDMFTVVETVRVTGTSDEISICSYTDVGGQDRTLAFLPRHGADHILAPHQVPYRANIAALRSLGVTQILATCIAGSLRRRIRPGDLVIPDQFVNLTWGRDPDGPDELIHVPMGDPYCSRLRNLAAVHGARTGLRTRRRGTIVVIQGPRFSTRAESRWFSRQGWDLVNMTAHPEVYLAREAGLCYTTLAMITDYDVGIRHRAVFTHRGSATPVLEVFRRNVAALKTLLQQLVPHVPTGRTCTCASPMPPEYYKQLETR